MAICETKFFEMAEKALANESVIEHNRAWFLGARLQECAEQWIEAQKKPCDFCGQPVGKGDHSQCILF